jgi:hypothetical protein
MPPSYFESGSTFSTHHFFRDFYFSGVILSAGAPFAPESKDRYRRNNLPAIQD